MSSDVVDSEIRKAKQPVNGRTSTANRDKSSFASRRRPSDTQRRSGFNTESTNTSYIPTPSPTKRTLVTGSHPKPRQALGNGRTLAGALRIAQDETRDKKSPTSIRQGPRPPQHKPTQRSKQQFRDRVSPRSTVKTASRARLPIRTPSPSHSRPDERPISPTSPGSVSSPPFGLAEAYQQIEDEESLAGQEDNSVDDMGEQEVGTAMGRAGTEDQDPLQSVREQQSFRTWSHSPYLPAAEEGHVNVQDPLNEDILGGEDYTQSSIGSSNLSSLSKSGGDTFQRILTQHAIDERRLKAVLSSESQPFKKTRAREKSGLTLENLQRKDASSKSGSSTLGSPTISSRESEPAPNVPKQWGQKARNGKSWLSRFNRDDGSLKGNAPTAPVSEAVEKSEPDRSKTSSQIVDWITTSDENRRPSTPEGLTEATSPLRKASPESAGQRQASREKRRRWDFLDDDFTARSVQMSDSPSIRLRGAALDAIREREMLNLEKSAVTTNRLGELREKRSVENVRQRSRSSASDAKRDEVGKTRGDMREKNNDSSISHAKSSLEKEEEVEEEEQAVVIHKEPIISNQDVQPISSASTVQISMIERGESQPPKRPLVQRPNHERSDSRDLLRRLARVTSTSPTPNLPKEPVDRTEVSSQQDPQSDPKGSTSSKTAEIGKEQTPQQPKQNIYAKTPQVTGAWVETPLPKHSDQPLISAHTSSNNEPGLTTAPDKTLDKAGSLTADAVKTLQPTSETTHYQSLEDTAPSLPRSALAAIIDRAKRKNSGIIEADNVAQSDDTLCLDDSTIQSLEELLASHNELVASLDTSTAQLERVEKAPLEETSKAMPDDELSSYSHLSSRLSALGNSIREAKKGIASLERAVSTVPSTALVSSTSDCPEAGEVHDFLLPCSRCGCPGGIADDDWQPLRIPRLASPYQLWTWTKGETLPRATWPGIAVASLLGLLWMNAAVEYALPSPRL